MIYQIYKFLGISGIGWLLDFSIFTILGVFLDNLFKISMISALAGATFVFAMSPKFIFKNYNGISLKIKYIFYISYQICLIMLISYMIVKVDFILTQYVTDLFSFINEFCYILAKILVTPFAMLCNFIVLKLLIEKI